MNIYIRECGSFLVTEDDEVEQPQDGDVLEVIKAPKPSKWEKDDSESDSKQALPATKVAKAPVKPLSR